MLAQSENRRTYTAGDVRRLALRVSTPSSANCSTCSPGCHSGQVKNCRVIEVLMITQTVLAEHIETTAATVSLSSECSILFLFPRSKSGPPNSDRLWEVVINSFEVPLLDHLNLLKTSLEIQSLKI
jgi:hypothetical protein